MSCDGTGMRRSETTAALRVALALTFVGVGTSLAADRNEAPGEEVMRPTRYGLTASEQWLEPLMGMMIEERAWGDGLELSDEAKDRLAGAMTRRGMEFNRTHGRDMQDFLEFAVQAAFEHDGPRNFDSRTGQEFARRFLPVAGPMRDFVDGTIADGREFLSPEEAQDLERAFGRFRHMIDVVEKRMKRWADGSVDDHGNPFRIDAADRIQRTPEEEAREDRRLQARRTRARSERELREFSPETWPEFIRSCTRYFGFDDKQRGQAEALRVEYAEHVRSGATPEWRSKAVENRIQRAVLAEGARDEPVGPWLFRLDQQFKALTGPVQELDGAFRKAVIALATPEQRRAALEKTTAAARRHGLSEKDMAPVEAVLAEP